jgi:hypothetical protein
MQPRISGRVAFPVTAIFGNALPAHVNTGFLAKGIDGTHWLVTVGHVACWPDIGLHFDFEHWSSWVAVLDVKNPRPTGDTPIKIPLMATIGTRRVPICSLISNGGGEVMDVLAAEFPLESYQRAGMLNDAVVVDLTSPTPPMQSPGPVVAHGFPLIDGANWPDRISSERTGTVNDLQRGLYVAKLDTDAGFCGAPVLDRDGSFVGMLNKSDYAGFAAMVPGFVIWALVNNRVIDESVLPTDSRWPLLQGTASIGRMEIVPPSAWLKSKPEVLGRATSAAGNSTPAHALGNP